MDEAHQKIKEAAQKAAINIDHRLSSFFELDNMAKTGLIYEELNSSVKYSEQKEVASGGMKTIYSVYDRHADRVLAMAQLHEGSSEEMFEPFLREARLTARLDHPNIIKIHDISLNKDKLPFFTMDFKTGQNLGQILRGKRLDISALLVIFIKVCDAISYAHSHGVLHLDLKPDNIQVGEHGEVIVCDWGLAKIIDDDSFSNGPISDSDLLNNMTLHGKVKGTPGYMAPEQTGMTNYQIGMATDIYSLGTILYEILCGKTPFTGDIKAILEKTAEGRFILPSAVSKVPKRLEGICLKAMKRDPEDRYGKIEDLKNDITAYQNGYLTSAEEFTIYKALMLFCKRHKATSITLTLAILIILSFIFVFIANQEKAKNLALQSKENAEKITAAAIKSEKRARDLALQYQQEKEESIRRGKASVPPLLSECMLSWRLSETSQAKVFLENALNLDPENARAIELNSRLLCSLFKFTAVLQFLEEKGFENKSTDRSLTAQCFRLATKYKDSDRDLSEDFKFKIIQDVFNSSKYMLADDFVYSLMTQNLDIDKRLDYSKKLIMIFNPELERLNFNFNVETGHLDLSHNPKMAWALCLDQFPANSLDISFSGLKNCQSFRNMPVLEINASNSSLSDFSIAYLSRLRKLDISHTVINSLSRMPHRLEVLDIRQTPINSLSSLKRLGQMKELLVHKDQFNEEELKDVSSKISISIK
jgi:eukaryotic-like serine/threonine-protein kinase